MPTFLSKFIDRKYQRKEVGGQKNQNLVNVVCEWPHRAGTAASYIRFGWVVKIQA